MDMQLQQGDALVIVDVQRDFIGGSVAVPEAEQLIPVIEHYIGCFRNKGLSIFASHDRNACSAFEVAGFEDALGRAAIHRLFVGGFPTEYGVLATVRDGISKGYQVFLLADAIRAADRNDGAFAVRTMLRLGAELLHEQEVGSAPRSMDS